jgi:hypothetical protein
MPTPKKDPKQNPPLAPDKAGSPIAMAIATIAGQLNVEKETVSAGTGGTYQAFTMDRVYEAVRPLLADAGIAIFPRPPDVTYVEHARQGGGVQTTARYKGSWMLVHGPTGDEVLIGFEASARDTGDKAPIQAGQQALKYALVQLFQISAGDPEAEQPPEEAIDPAEAQQIEDENQERLENAARKHVWEYMAGEKVDGDQQKAEAEAAWPLVLEAAGVTDIATEKDRDAVTAAADRLYGGDEAGEQEKLEDK